jgi:hypothetical protein
LDLQDWSKIRKHVENEAKTWHGSRTFLERVRRNLIMPMKSQRLLGHGLGDQIIFKLNNLKILAKFSMQPIM